MLASRSSRIALVASIILGVICIFAIPPYLYFRFDRFAAGLPQPFLAFDPDRFLADAPPRDGLAVACISAVKFASGVGFVWICYGVAQFIRRGSSSNSSSTP